MMIKVGIRMEEMYLVIHKLCCILQQLFPIKYLAEILVCMISQYYFQAVIGSLTVIVVFALVRVLGGTTAGVIASLLFAVALPVLVRGSIGWFKSEPLGIFYGLLGLYLFLSGIRTKDKKFTILKIVSGGIILSFAMASWGGNQFFIIPIGLFILALPLVRKDHKFLAWSIPLFVTTFPFMFCFI